MNPRKIDWRVPSQERKRNGVPQALFLEKAPDGMCFVYYDIIGLSHNISKLICCRQGDVVCFKCQAPNHRQDECPLNNIKKTTGIPKIKLEYVSADTPDAMLTPDGKFALIKQPL